MNHWHLDLLKLWWFSLPFITYLFINWSYFVGINCVIGIFCENAYIFLASNLLNISKEKTTLWARENYITKSHLKKKHIVCVPLSCGNVLMCFFFIKSNKIFSLHANKRRLRKANNITDVQSKLSYFTTDLRDRLKTIQTNM